MTYAHDALPIYVCIRQVSFLPPELLFLAQFSAAVYQLPFVGYRIDVDCGCSFRDEFCTPFIIVAMGRFFLGFSSLVVTEAVALVVLLFLIGYSFTACYLSVSLSIRC